ncbi:cupin domain-containing protein [Arthrobacter globiformis]|uniref:cupin domain-containing protein n=1 Tax=Arthrobacter globiformis TaxID=1665 RepID=UPI0027878294|nr:cupin domain-containing protein [Arthrobacter globiformis]MDQ0867337.1 quercetin dioxygenase-like cupin family protein [Arthrobacter globiformis]
MSDNTAKSTQSQLKEQTGTFVTRADAGENEIVHGVGITWLVPEGSMRKETELPGSFLDFIGEFTVDPGAQLEPHYHDTYEFYYVLSGEGVMQIEMEAAHVRPGDLIKIDRNARHTIRATGTERIHCLAFATSFQKPGERFIPCELPSVEPAE